MAGIESKFLKYELSHRMPRVKVKYCHPSQVARDLLNKNNNEEMIGSQN